MTNPSRKDWSRLFEDILWAHRTANRTPLGMSPYRIFFVKQCNLAYDQAGKQRKFQLQELDKLCLEAYENYRIYKVPSRSESKLHSRWDGPFVITNLFHEGPTPIAGDMETISLMLGTIDLGPSRESRPDRLIPGPVDSLVQQPNKERSIALTT
ncbi:hypothetical protein CR513_18865, partial [Mucuna pruriens]